MAHNEKTIGMKEQKHLGMPLVKAFDKEKLLAMQKQVVEGMTQNGNSIAHLRTSEETSSRSLEKYENPWRC